jgi:hypothetical protein
LRLFLQINIVDWKETSYSKPLLSFASSLASDIVGTDLDCQSEAFIADLVIKLIGEAESIFVLVIAADETLPLSSALKVFNHLIKAKEKVHLALLSGEHAAAEKMLKPFQINFKKQDDDSLIRKLIKQFAYSK